MDIKLEVYVGKRTAGSLTSGKARLNDILILHLRGGRDIFVTVRYEEISYIPNFWMIKTLFVSAVVTTSKVASGLASTRCAA